MIGIQTYSMAWHLLLKWVVMVVVTVTCEKFRLFLNSSTKAWGSISESVSLSDESEGDLGVGEPSTGCKKGICKGK